MNARRQDQHFLCGASRHPNIELRLLKKGDHRLSDYKEEIAEAACDFFTRHLAAKG